MRKQLLDIVEKPFLKPTRPEFRIGDSVDVHCRIKEGDKERIQVYSGVVIARRGTGINEHFTVRRLVKEEGVERTFMLHSPHIVSVQVQRSGKARRAKLYYLRSRVGKARKLRELRVSKKEQQADVLVGAGA